MIPSNRVLLRAQNEDGAIWSNSRFMNHEPLSIICFLSFQAPMGRIKLLSIDYTRPQQLRWIKLVETEGRSSDCLPRSSLCALQSVQSSSVFWYHGFRMLTVSFLPLAHCSSCAECTARSFSLTLEIVVGSNSSIKLLEIAVVILEGRIPGPVPPLILVLYSCNINYNLWK